MLKVLCSILNLHTARNLKASSIPKVLDFLRVASSHE